MSSSLGDADLIEPRGCCLRSQATLIGARTGIVARLDFARAIEGAELQRRNVCYHFTVIPDTHSCTTHPGRFDGPPLVCTRMKVVRRATIFGNVAADFREFEGCAARASARVQTAKRPSWVRTGSGSKFRFATRTTRLGSCGPIDKEVSKKPRLDFVVWLYLYTLAACGEALSI